MSELNGKISTSGELRSTINTNTRLKGLVSVGGVLIDTTFDKRGLKGETGDTGDTGNGIESIEKTSTSGLVDTYTITYTDGTETTFDLTNGQDGVDGQDGSDGFSPSASVSKVGRTATITITDKDGTTTAEVHDGSGGGDVTDVTVDGTSIVDSDGVAELETVTQLRNGLMTALDKQKLDGIASGAEVNVNADWNAVSGDAQILNKPSIPTKVSDLTNDSGFLTAETDPTVPSWAKASSKPSYTASEVGALPDTTQIPSKTSDLTNDSGFISTETDPVFTASDAYGITSSDITNWDNSYDGKVSLDTSAASGTDHDLYAAIVALGWQNDVID